MEYIINIIFIVLLISGLLLFTKNVVQIRRNILLGKPVNRTDNQTQRWKTMFRVAMGQSKMVTRPLPGILHLFVYIGFVVINIEVIEIVIDGVSGSHRVFSVLSSLYTFLIATFEILAALVFLGCVIFLRVEML